MLDTKSRPLLLSGLLSNIPQMLLKRRFAKHLAAAVTQVALLYSGGGNKSTHPKFKAS